MFIKRSGSDPKPVKQPQKRATRIKPVSDKRAHEVFLEEHENCEVCGGKASQVHHKQGRNNGWLNKVAHWLAVCDPCHRKITDNSLWAFEMGYSEYRNR